jgi:hypothetical protein
MKPRRSQHSRVEVILKYKDLAIEIQQKGKKVNLSHYRPEVA